MTLNITLLETAPLCSEDLLDALARADCEIRTRVESGANLLKSVLGDTPDVIVIHVDTPDRELLVSLARLQDVCPRPVVLFTDHGDRATIEHAIRAGVSAYVVDGISRSRVGPVISAAIARFQEFQSLRRELQETRSQLADRRDIERAKGILGQHRGMDEQAAYAALRKVAMDRGQKLGEVARNVIAVVAMMGEEVA